MEPKTIIRNLIYEARSLREESEREWNSINSPMLKVGGSLAVEVGVPYGLKRSARELGRAFLKKRKKEYMDRWNGRKRSFLEKCKRELSKIAIKDRPSRDLSKSLNSARRLKTPWKSFEKVAEVLEELLSYDLVMRDELKYGKDEAKKEDLIERYNLDGLIRDLERYPTVRDSLLGAVESLKSRNRDKNVHCIASCRKAIEELCIAIGEEKDWKRALTKAVRDRSRRKIIKETHHYLSSRGLHGGRRPTRKDAEQALTLTRTSLESILGDKRNA